MSPAWPFPFRDRRDGRLSRRQWRWLVAAFLALHYAALGISVVTGNFDPNPNHDHVQVMRSVLEKGYPEVAIWPPGFGYYLALKWRLTAALGLPYWTGKLFLDVLLTLAAGVAATRLGQVLTRNRLLALAAGLGMVGAPLFALASAEELAGLLFQPFFLLALVLLVEGLQAEGGGRVRRMALAGAALGLACLVRANPQFLALAIAPGVVWLRRREGARHPYLDAAALLAVLIAAQVVVLAPWLWWQRRLGAEGVFAAPVIWYAYLDGLKRHPGNPVSDWVAEHYDELPQSFATVVAIHRKWLREDPAALLRLYALKFVRNWYLSDSGRWDRAILLLHGPFWLGALAGVAVWWRRCRGDPALLLVLATVLYMWAVSALVSGLARYLTPVYGLLGLLTGVAARGPLAAWAADDREPRSAEQP